MFSQFLALVLLLVPALYLIFKTIKPTPKIVKESDIGRPRKPLNRTEVNEDDITVTGLYVFPIKSCRGTTIREAHWTPQGFRYDRKWCIITADDHHVITLRGLGEMVHIHPEIKEDPKSPYGGTLVVDVPSRTGGMKTFILPLNPTSDILAKWEHLRDVVMFQKFEMDGYICQSLNPEDESPADILSAYLKKQVYLVMKGPDERMSPPTNAFPDLIATCYYPDAYPIHFASEESLASLNRAVNMAAQLSEDALPKEVRGISGAWQGRTVEMERFRPNIVLKGAGVPYAEDLWREVEIKSSPARSTEGHSQVITMVDQCARCLLPNVDSKTGERDLAVPYKVIIKYGNADNAKKPIFGTYAVPVGHGSVRVGDKLKVRQWIEKEVIFDE